MPNSLLISVGAVINMFLISAPLFYIDIQWYEYFNRPATWGYYLLACVFCVAESKQSLSLSSVKHSTANKAYLPYIVGACVLMVFWLAIYDFANHAAVSIKQSAIGCVMALAGVFVRLVSIKQLNVYFVSHVAHINNHRLITTGIYSVVRHPSELGLLLICLGVAVMLSSLSGLLMVAFALLPLTLYRIELEDALLESLFDAQHKAYKANTPSLLPKLA